MPEEEGEEKDDCHISDGGTFASARRRRAILLKMVAPLQAPEEDGTASVSAWEGLQELPKTLVTLLESIG